LSFLFAVLTYRFLELPIRQRRNLSTGFVLAGGAAVIGAVAVTVVLHRGLPGRFPPAVSAMRPAPREDEREFMKAPYPRWAPDIP